MLTWARRSFLQSAVALSAGGSRLWAAPARAPAGLDGASDILARAPRPSDVVMRTGRYRPEAIPTARAFEATRCEWLYSTDQSYVEELKTVVGHVGLSMHPTMAIPNAAGAARDVDGSLVTPPWMAGQAPWNTIFKPATRDGLFGAARANILAGANSIQLDDAGLDFDLAAFSGGDFSQETIAAFRTWSRGARLKGPAAQELAASDHDISRWVIRQNNGQVRVDWRRFAQEHERDETWIGWKTFLRSNSATFLRDLRAYVHSTGRIPLSMNVPNPLPIWSKTFQFDHADYLISEIIGLTAPHQLMAYCACADAWGLPFVPSMVPLEVGVTRWAIALAYALGANPLVPWDTFIAHKPRYFGSPGEYGDLFHFVRSNPVNFDDYGGAADAVLVFQERTSQAEEFHDAAAVCASLGLPFRLAIVRADGSVTGKRAPLAPPSIVVAVNVSTAQAQHLFPGARVTTLKALSMLRSDAIPVLHAMSSDARQIVAVPRLHKSEHKLLVHIVNTRGDENPLGDRDELSVVLPAKYARYANVRSTARIVDSKGLELTRDISSTSSGQNMILRVSLAGIRTWGVVAIA